LNALVSREVHEKNITAVDIDKNAIEHLGHASDSVRLGGAYELFHLAQDTKDLRQTVLDILCAHIRQTTGEDEYRKKYKSKPSEEIQSLLTLLFVQEHKVFKGLHINLQGSWLNGADLKEACLARAILTGVHLQQANLSYTKMPGAVLRNADLQEAELDGSRLQRANLRGAHLQGATLADAFLESADLIETQLQGVDLFDAQLQGAVLMSAQLQGADLSGANLKGVISQSEHLFFSFERRIEALVGRESDLSGIIFSGGLNQENVNSLIADLSEEKAKELQYKLASHINETPSYQLPENTGATT